MDRRAYLATSLGMLTGAVAGCAQLPEDGDSDTVSSSFSEGRLSPDEYPEVEWQERWLTGSEYSVTVTVAFNGADQVSFVATGGQTVTILDRGSHDGKPVEIAGEGTGFGPIESPKSIRAEVDRADLPAAMVDSYMVGLEDRPSRPFHLTGQSGTTAPDLEDDDDHTRSFSYDFDGHTYGLSLSIPESLYSYYTERVRSNDRGVYVADPYQQPYLSTLADEFGARGSQETVEQLMAFVQQLPYTEDRVSAGIRQYTSYPMETLFDEGGDCEDTAILLAALMDQVGFDTVLLAFWDEQHMALGVAGEESLPGAYYEYRGTRYYYLETTAPGWRVGQVPPDIEGTSAEIQAIRNHPTLVFAWTTMPALEDEGVEIDIAVRNEGDVRARNVHLSAHYETRAGRTVATEATSRFDIRPTGSHEETIALVPPDDVELRCVVEASVDGELHDRAASEWRGPDEFVPDG